MKIIFIRHGKTISNMLKTYSEETTPLCESSYQDLLLTKERLKDFHFEKVYASPLLRVKQTVEALGLTDVEYDVRLKECNFGKFSGKTYEMIEKEYPEELKLWFSDPINGRPPEGESSFDQFTRIAEFLTEISKTGQDSLVVCHYGTISMAIAWALGNFDLWSKFVPENGLITEIETDGTYSSITRFNC